MKRKSFFTPYLAFVLTLVLAISGCAEDDNPVAPVVPVTPEEVFDGEILYVFASSAPSADAYSVAINGKPYFVFSSQTADIISFGIDGKVKVEIVSQEPVRNVKIRPENAGIIPVVKNDTIALTLSGPQYLSIEVNGKPERPLLLFADAPEKDVPDRNDPDFVYFGAGRIYSENDIPQETGKNFYLAPGAILYGNLKAYGGENLRISGRGILSGAKYAKQEHREVELTKMKNVSIEGITIVDSKHWTVALSGCENVEVKNVKIVNKAATDDGINIIGSSNVVVDSCFIHTADDCIALKAGIDYFTLLNDTEYNIENVTVKNSIFWNAIPESNVFEIGYELNCDTVKNIRFENNDIIHLPGRLYSEKGAFSIHNSGRAIIEDIVYSRIRIEDASVYLMDFEVMLDLMYSKEHPKHGKIRNIYLEDITVRANKTMRSILRSYSETAKVEQLRIKNLSVNGQKAAKQEDLHLTTTKFMPEISIE